MAEAIRYPNLTIALSNLERPIRSSSEAERHKVLDGLQVHVILDSIRSPCWITASETLPVFDRLRDTCTSVGGVVTDSHVDERATTFPLGEMPSRVRLQEAAVEPTTNRILVLHDCKKTDSDASFAHVMEELSWHDGLNQECVVLKRADDKQTIRAVVITPLGNTSPEALIGIPDCQILVFQDASSRHALPIGFTHPVLEHHPWLVHSHNTDSVLAWSTQSKEGDWIEYKVLSAHSTPIADLIEVSTFSASETLPKHGVGEFPKLEVTLVPDRREKHDQPSAANVVIMIESRADQLDRQVLDILDNTEFGEQSFSTAMVYSEKRGVSELAPVRHFIRFKATAPPDIIPTKRIRCYVQSKAFEDVGIPLFIEQGYAFRPDLQTVLPHLARGHPLVQQLESKFAAGDGDIHLLEISGNDQPVRRVLRGGKKLQDCISPLLFNECLRSESEDSMTVDLLMSDQINKKLHARRKSHRDRIRKEGHNEATLVGAELSQTIDALGRLIEESETKLMPISTRISDFRKQVTLLDKQCEDSPTHWWKIAGAVEKFNKRILQKRLLWIKDTNNKLDNESQAIEEARNAIEDIAAKTRDRVHVLKTLLESANEEKEALNNAITSGKNLGAAISNSTVTANNKYKEAAVLMARFSSTLNTESERLRLVANRIEEKRRELDLRRVAVENEETRLTELEQEQKAKGEALNSRKSRAEIRRDLARRMTAQLERLRDETIPNVEAEVREAEEFLSSINEKALRRRLQTARKANENLQKEVQRISAQQNSVEQERLTANRLGIALDDKIKKLESSAKSLKARHSNNTAKEAKIQAMRRGQNEQRLDGFFDAVKRTIFGRKSDK